MKSLRALLLLGLTTFALPVADLSAAEVTGTVREATGSTATIQTSGGTPAVGDAVEIFFKLPGIEEEILVASGRVISKEAGALVKVKIESATGVVVKDQLARFASSGWQKPDSAVPDALTPEQSYALGLEYFRGGGSVLIDRKKAYELYERAAEQGLPEAQARLATLWNGIGGQDFVHERDEKKAMAWAQRAIASGLEARSRKEIAAAQYELAELSLVGLGVPKDDAKAVQLFQAAAKQGNRDALHMLGFLYFSGNGGATQNIRTAEQYFLQADIATSQQFLGMTYGRSEARDGLEPSKEKAAECFRRAADQGSAAAMELLGEYYEKGEGVSASLADAIALYEKSALRGNWSALVKLGELYENGRGVPRDLHIALSYYQRAAEQNAKKAKEAVDRLRRENPALAGDTQ